MEESGMNHNGCGAGVISIMGVVFAVLISACAPNKAITKEQIFSSGKNNARTVENEASFTYSEESDYAFDIENGKSVKPNRPAAKNIAVDADSGFIDGSLKKEKFYQTGEASWYGREFHGRVTASGERFNMNEYTAAHRTLPFGTVVMVKNLDNGKSVQVRINDRGPYKKNRILDLSYAAAKDLDMISSGEAVVGIVPVKSGAESNQRTIGVRQKEEVEPVYGGARIADDERMAEIDDSIDSNYSRISLQAGAFYSKKKAGDLKKRIEDYVDKPVVLYREGDMYKVRIENIGSRGDADRYRRMLEKRDIPSYVIENKE